jgi:steroid delta-isomerase-like uncharacterized protein
MSKRKEKTMSDTNKAAARQYFESVNNRDTASLGTIVADDVRYHGMQVSGLDQLVSKVGEIVHAIPDFNVTIEDLIAEGDRVVARTKERGTQENEFEGMPATGRSFEVDEVNIFRFENGKIAEVWQISDQLGFLSQLGLLPEPTAS